MQGVKLSPLCFFPKSSGLKGRFTFPQGAQHKEERFHFKQVFQFFQRRELFATRKAAATQLVLQPSINFIHSANGQPLNMWGFHIY